MGFKDRSIHQSGNSLSDTQIIPFPKKAGSHQSSTAYFLPLAYYSTVFGSISAQEGLCSGCHSHIVVVAVDVKAVADHFAEEDYSQIFSSTNNTHQTQSTNSLLPTQQIPISTTTAESHL